MNFLQTLRNLASVLALTGCVCAVRAEDTNAAPDFKEVYDLIHANLAGQGDEELNRAAVQGLLDQLHTKVSLVSNKADSQTPSEAPLLSKSEVYDGASAYIRVGRVAEGLGDKIGAAFEKLSGTNKLKGVVLDLRFAGGHDYAAAAAAADRFIAKEVPLLDPGKGMIRSKEKTNAIALPVVVLVNRQTAAAAEALAAVLRESDQGVIIGAATAGEATIGKDYPLKNGQFLRIATAAIKLGNGDAIPAGGIKPDIAVSVRPDDEKVYFADPYKELPSTISFSTALMGTPAGATTTTNRPRPRPNEADLIRERKERPGMEVEGVTSSENNPAADADTDKPVVRDPVLGRALDLVKGIAALKQPRNP